MLAYEINIEVDVMHVGNITKENTERVVLAFLYLRAFIRSISIWRLASSSASLKNLCLFELPKIPSISIWQYAIGKRKTK